MSASDLTTLAQVQAWAGTLAAGNSEQTVALIGAISDQILGELARDTVLPYAYSETLDGEGQPSIMLRRWPVLSVTSLVIDGQAIPAAAPNAIGVTAGSGWLLAAADPFPPGRQQILSLVGCRRFCRGRQNVTVSYVAGYQVTGEPATVPVGGAVKAKQSLGAWASDQGVTYASNGAALTAVSGAPAQGQYSVAVGSYTFAAADAGASVLISYGFIPQALAMAAAQWVAESISYSQRIGIRTKTLGGQETIAYDTAPMPGRVDKMLQPYRRVTLL